MIRKFLIFVLFANAFSSIPINAEDNVDYDSIINSAVDAIKNEHARSEDVLYALSNSNPEEFMRKVVPIGELVAKEINPKLFIESICVTITHGDLPTSRDYYIDYYIKHISSKVEHISKQVANWLNESLSSSWPSIHHQIIREQFASVLSKSKYFSDKMLKKVIELSLPKLKSTGPKK
uniref:DUF2059 domain-containing protein n=1 Tax=Meloidogyne hapla TaxID=6305 RepID=A0A1I8BT18_MELHA